MDQAGNTAFSKEIISRSTEVASSQKCQMNTLHRSKPQHTVRRCCCCAVLRLCCCGVIVQQSMPWAISVCTLAQRRSRQSRPWSFIPANGTQRAHQLQLTHGAAQLCVKPLPPWDPHPRIQLYSPAGDLHIFGADLHKRRQCRFGLTHPVCGRTLLKASTVKISKLPP